jgi:plasmid stabilization system protein ParE
MSRDIIFSCVARLEFDEAILWYDEQQPGLGDEFEAEINHVIEEIQKTPERFRFASLETRKARLLGRFNRYSIYFYAQPDHIGIVSVFDGARNPAELRRRLK